MKKAQKEIQLHKLSDEERELKLLKSIYEEAVERINDQLVITNGKIKVLLADLNDLDEGTKSVLQSQIWHKNFQEGISRQLNGFLNELNRNQYKSIDEYLNACYETGFIGAMYELSDQGIPLIMPIDQKKVVKAIRLDTKLSKELYTKLGENLDDMKKRVSNSISRGVAFSDSYENIARNIRNDSRVSFNQAMRIARTEGARINNEVTFENMIEAKKRGADILKEWCATLDKKTRPHHSLLDGQIKKIEEPFEINGMTAMHPLNFNRPEEDINCRCFVTQKARWGLDEEELEVLKERAAYFGLDKTKDFREFKKKYLEATNKIEDFTQRTIERIYDETFTIEIKDEGTLLHTPIKKAYDDAIMKRGISFLTSLGLYATISEMLDEKISGLNTKNGVQIKGKQDQIVNEFIGFNDITISDIVLALTEPDETEPVKMQENKKTQRFILKGICAVVINIETGELLTIESLK